MQSLLKEFCDVIPAVWKWKTLFWISELSASENGLFAIWKWGALRENKEVYEGKIHSQAFCLTAGEMPRPVFIEVVWLMTPETVEARD